MTECIIPKGVKLYGLTTTLRRHVMTLIISIITNIMNVIAFIMSVITIIMNVITIIMNVITNSIDKFRNFYRLFILIEYEIVLFECNFIQF
jgi:phage-related protein